MWCDSRHLFVLKVASRQSPVATSAPSGVSKAYRPELFVLADFFDLLLYSL